MAKAALVIGVVAVFLAVLPLSAATQIIGLLLGTLAAVLGYWLRGQGARRGEPTGAATTALACGLVAVVLGGLVFASCQACSGEGEVDPVLETEFRKTIGDTLGSEAAGSEGDENTATRDRAPRDRAPRDRATVQPAKSDNKKK